MEASQIYILIAIIGLLLVVVALFVIGRNRKRMKLTPLTGIAFAFVIGSMAFENRIIAYPLIGLGIIIAIIDVILKRRR